MKHETFFNNYKNPILATSKVKILNPKIVVIFGSTLRGRACCIVPGDKGILVVFFNF
jgi:hypothetical protein